MKLHILSDTHGKPIVPHPAADLIVHAGDFGNGGSGAQAFQAACQRAGKPCIFVLGNHDFYGENIDELPRELIAADAPLLTAYTAPQYANSPLNPYFINDIDLTGFAYWIAGHTHQAFDGVQNGCRIINPLGYPNEHGQNGYRDGLLLELPD